MAKKNTPRKNPAPKNTPLVKKPDLIQKAILQQREQASIIPVQARPFSMYPEDHAEVHLKLSKRSPKEEK